MISMIQTIILSYINKYNIINIGDIREAVNEPIGLIAKEVAALYEEGFFEKVEKDLFVTEKGLQENISQWNVWIEAELKDSDFFSPEHCLVKKDENGYPIMTMGLELDNILKLKHMNTRAYHVFYVTSNDKIREITAPSKKLKARQQWILRNILEKYKLPDCVHGFVKKRSIVSNAECHLNKREVGCIDIKDFFPSVDYNKVYEIFCKIGYNKEVSIKLAELCTFNRVLPQGAPTSPMLANIALEEFDIEMLKYSSKYSLSYSRYADDLTISGDCDISPHVCEMKKMINNHGFNDNEKKTHIMKDNYRKIVTGLVITDTVKVPKRYKKVFRQEIYYCKRFGIEQHLKNIGRTSAVNFKEYMYGKAYYIKMVEEKVGEGFLLQLDEIFSLEN